MPLLVHAGDPGYVLERFTVKQAANYLSLPVSQVYALAAARAISYRRDTAKGRIRFSQADLDAWREARHVDVAPKFQRSTSTVRPRARTAVATLPLPAKRRFA
jgi:excisionase family DNA binding protein